MFIKTCKHCRKTFEAPKRAGSYCLGSSRCFSASENAKSRNRYLRYSPERRKAALAVARSLLNGELERRPCEVCGKDRYVQAHHDDYAVPLEVRWLCVSHHRLHHIKHGPGKNAFIEGEQA